MASMVHTVLLAENEHKVGRKILNFCDWIREQLTQPTAWQQQHAVCIQGWSKINVVILYLINIINCSEFYQLIKQVINLFPEVKHDRNWVRKLYTSTVHIQIVNSTLL